MQNYFFVYEENQGQQTFAFWMLAEPPELGRQLPMLSQLVEHWMQGPAAEQL
jgi:hypothetical protein